MISAEQQRRAEEWHRKVVQAYLNYLRRMSEAGTKTRSQTERAFAEHWGTAQAMSKELNDRFTEACQAYVQSLATAWGPSEARKQCEDCYNAYIDALGQLVHPASEERLRIEQAYNEFLGELQESVGGADAEQRSGAATQKCLGRMRRVWDKSMALERTVKTAEEYGQSVQTLHATSQGETLKAYRTLVESLAKVEESENTTRTLNESLKRYMDALGQVWSELRDAYAVAGEQLSSEIRRANDEFTRGM